MIALRRRHDVQVLAEGTFRIVMTDAGRIAAIIELEESALGPLHLLLPVESHVQTGGFDFGHVVSDIGHAVSHATSDVGHVADQTFHAASKVAGDVARPAFNTVRDAAASGAHLIASMPYVAKEAADNVAAAARTVMRARMGDIVAKDFIRNIANAANQGLAIAKGPADALLTGTKVVAHVLDTPMALAAHIPVIGGTLHALDPWQKLERVADAIKRGDFEGLKNVATDDLRMMQGVVSLVPGIGSGIGAAIGTGLAVLDGGGALDVAIQAAYGAIPIPPGMRDVTDAVLSSVLSLAHSGNVTDAALAAARNAVPAGLPRDVFDTLAQLVIKRVPIQRAADALVKHYVDRYAPGALPPGIAETVAHVAQGGGITDAAASIAAQQGARLLGAR